jgi:hypothetical protein
MELETGVTEGSSGRDRYSGLGECGMWRDGCMALASDHGEPNGRLFPLLTVALYSITRLKFFLDFSIFGSWSATHTFRFFFFFFFFFWNQHLY